MREERLEEVVGLSEDPELWNDPKKAQEIGKERKMLEGIVLASSTSPPASTTTAC